MNQQEIAQRWLDAFGGSCSKEFINKHVRAQGNFLWHIFSWNQVDCLKEEAADAAFDELDYDAAFLFCSGRADREGFQIKGFAACEKLHASQLEAYRDVYVVASDFTWTYVRTHEHPAIGPFFCKKK